MFEAKCPDEGRVTIHGEVMDESMGTGHFDSSKTSQNDLSPLTHILVHQQVYRQYLFSQKDIGHLEQLIYKPIYMLPFVPEELSGQ